MDPATMTYADNETFKTHLLMEWEVSNGRSNSMAELKRLYDQTFPPSYEVNKSSYSRTKQTSGNKLIFRTCAPEATSQVIIMR